MLRVSCALNARREQVVATEQQVHEIVIVGGGAGGLELATRLGNKLGKKKDRAHITLIDASPSHLWKPLLYEVAAGSLDSYAERLEYLAQAHWHHFRFRLGRMDGLDRARQEISVAPTLDEDGVEIIPRRSFRYDTLIIAVGSVGNDFGVPGVKEHCIMLDTPEQAREFHRRHINACLRAHTQTAAVTTAQHTVCIVGAGATGVELAAELHDTTRELSAYGLEKIDPDKTLKLLIVEASDRILPGLPPRLSAAAAERLAELGVEVYTNERVVEVRADGMLTADGKLIPASMMVWSAGIKAPDFLKEIDGLETNRSNQLVVRPTLQTTRDDNIFALGDCAACPMPDGRNVPPRAQAAHQQASLMAKAICRRFRGKPLLDYEYRDYGSLVALGRFSTVGNLMGGLSGGSIMIEGVLARLVYWSLHKMHEVALHGWVKTAMTTYAHFISTPTRARIKLH
ncbi:MAG: NAD(P)/FAD-dependent oxidoreductase [Thiobacillus sp.]|nr:NAD(P)/FAD-dependent oxidoreductase [Thiobacillus sp.]